MPNLKDARCIVTQADLDDPTQLLNREWLTTNGIGGYASGTLAGALARSYHAFLAAASPSPTCRVVLVGKVEESIVVNGVKFDLSSNVYSGVLQPQGFKLVEQFEAWPHPRWIYRLAENVFIEKTIIMAPGLNATWARYRLIGTASAVMTICPWLCHKSYHSVQNELLSAPLYCDLSETTVRLQFDDSAQELRLYCPTGAWEQANWWYRNIQLTKEAERGLDASENELCAGWFRVTLTEENPIWFCATSEKSVGQPPEIVSDGGLESMNPLMQALESAAKVFIVAPRILDSGVRQGRNSIIAGYHWFTDWGRDTFISLPGLAPNMDSETVVNILETFAGTINDGTVANRFPDDGGPLEYNTADASLWFILAVCRFVNDGIVPATRQNGLLKACMSILDAIRHGTRHGVWQDREDGLIVASAPGKQLTWMDARLGDHVVTPRGGKAVEINALCHAALRSFASINPGAGKTSKEMELWADRLQASYRKKFVRTDGQGLYDVLTQFGPDASIRPNQIFAVSLNDTLLEWADAKAVVDVVERYLLTRAGLRTLSPEDPSYCPRYHGDVWKRDNAYHQGTVWIWLLGPFAEAHYRVYKDARAARRFLEPLGLLMTQYGVGYLPEVCDGDAPHNPGGCIAQAWSVAETLRVWRLLTGAMGESV